MKTSPFQSIVVSIDLEVQSSSHKKTNEITTLKIKTYCESKDDLLLANYSADKSIENLRQAIEKSNPDKLNRENKLFCHVFNDLWMALTAKYFL